MVHIKRVYEPPTPDDGYRVLVDRLWPRGVSKEKAQSEWLKDVAPSHDLRTWFGHRPERFAEFKKRYTAELNNNPAYRKLEDIVTSHRVVTLIYAARDPEHNEARILQELLNS